MAKKIKSLSSPRPVLALTPGTAALAQPAGRGWGTPLLTASSGEGRAGSAGDVQREGCSSPAGKVFAGGASAALPVSSSPVWPVGFLTENHLLSTIGGPDTGQFKLAKPLLCVLFGFFSRQGDLLKSLPRKGLDGLSLELTRDRNRHSLLPEDTSRAQGGARSPGMGQSSRAGAGGAGQGEGKAAVRVGTGQERSCAEGLHPSLATGCCLSAGGKGPQLCEPKTSFGSRAERSFLWKAEPKAAGKAWLHHPSYGPSLGWQKSPAPCANSLWPGMSQKACFKSFIHGTGRT